MATSVTWQFFSHARICLRSRVYVRNFLEVRLLRRRQHTNGDTVLVDVNTTTASMFYFHNRLLPIAERRTPG
jgi:hypothetical protein